MYNAFETEVDLIVIGGHETLPGDGKAKVKWAANIELRREGIYCIGLSVMEQTVKATVKQTNEDDEDVFTDVEFKINHENTKILEKDSSGNIGYVQLIPFELEAYNGKYELKF